MRLAYLGTPSASVPSLRALLDAGHDIRIVITQADKRRGRGGSLIPSPVAAAADELGLAVSNKVDEVIDAGVELGVVVAFGRLIRPHVLARVPMVNVHFSRLPRWRGAAPVERAILAGDTETGVCLMALEEGLDTGPVYECIRVPIDPEETADEVRAELVAKGTELVVRRLAGGFASLGEPAVQEGEPTYAAKIEPDELHLDWSQPAEQVHRVIRIGRAWTSFRGKRLQVLKARRAPTTGAGGPPGSIDGLLVACGDGGAVELVEVKPEGKAAQPAGAWRNGAHLRPAERLGE